MLNLFTDRNQVTRTKTEDGKLFIHTHFDDDAALAKNKVIRDENIMDKHSLGLHDDADTRLAISCPSTTQWSIFKRKHPDIYTKLHSKNEAERMKGARELAILEPSWVVFSRL